jgi:hypothetical protein
MGVVPSSVGLGAEFLGVSKAVKADPAERFRQALRLADFKEG